MRIATVAAIFVTLALPVSAHHSFSAAFDTTKQVTLTVLDATVYWSRANQPRRSLDASGVQHARYSLPPLA